MNKEEYMRNLESALKNCSMDRKQEILADFNEHFEIGLNEGRSEEEICESLGDISNFIDDLIIEKQELTTYHENQIRKIKIMSDMGDIVVEKNHEIGYELKKWNNMTQIYFDFETEIKDDTQYFRLKSKRSFQKIMKTPKLYVFIPSGYDVEVNGKLGDIEVNGMFDKLKIENKMGNIDVLGKAQECHIQNDLGDNHFDFEVDDGFMVIHKGDVDGKLKAKNISIETKMGDIKLEVSISGNALLDSKMGDIEMVPVDMNDFEIETRAVLGDVKCKLEDVTYSNKRFIKGNGKAKIKITTSLGDIKIKD
ncbi:MAG: HAAS signaling domain-containing protein [Traorella sp.]